MRIIKDNGKNRSFISEVLSFVLPVIVATIAYLGIGIYPGGTNTVLTYDLRAQLLPIYGYLSHSCPGFDNLFHSMSGGLGGGFFGTIVLYISPLDLVYFFVPLKYLPDAIYLMILVKIGLCGLFCCIYLKKNGKIMLGSTITVVFSCCYALMSYNFMYFMSPMWLDEVMLLPVLALFAEPVINGKKSPIFTVFCSIAIISDYYIAFMSVVALVIYFSFRIMEEDLKLRIAIRRFGLFAVHGLFSAGLSMAVILPTVIDLKKGKVSEDLFTSGILWKNSLSDIIKSLFAQNYAGLGYNASPSIFCGTMVLILTCICILGFKKNCKTSFAALIVVVIYFASFMFGPLDRFWHGFREPNNFSVRYAYTFSFFMIILASRGVQVLLGLKIKISDGLSKFIVAIMIFYTFVELYTNGAYILAKIGTESGYALREEYERFCDVYEEMIPAEILSTANGYGRVMTTDRFSSFDGALYGYDGMARFSSSYNFCISEFFRSVGVASIYQNLKDWGTTPPLAGLINGRYYLTFMKDYSDFYSLKAEYKGYRLYENENALPLAFEVNSFETEQPDFSENPFSNINMIYSELFGGDDSYEDVFVEQVYINLGSAEKSEEYNSSEKIIFTADHSGYYYVFVKYMIDKFFADDGHTDMPVLRNLYLDDVLLGDYGTIQFSFCVDLGYLNEGESHELLLVSSGMEIGDVYLYRYDDEAYGKTASEVNGLSIIEIGDNGIILDGEVSESSNVLVSLPYENGYKVYVDGVKTDYEGYRDTLMLIPVGAGSHEISIKYIPPGLLPGVLASLITLMLFIVWSYGKKIPKVLLRCLCISI